MFKKLLLLVATGLFLASCAATNTNQGGDASINSGTQEDLIVNVGDRVFFEFDSSELTVDAQSTLDAQAAWLMQYSDTNITIEGHADERGTREYNLALGDKRAFAVYSYLAQAGIDTNRMEYISWGSSQGMNLTTATPIPATLSPQLSPMKTCALWKRKTLSATCATQPPPI